MPVPRNPERDAALAADYRRGRLAHGFTARGFDWRGDQMRADMDIASRVFVRAIERERRRHA